MTTLQGKTLFITGASRGIGKAIGLRAARDGANIILVAKTVDPQKNLPGTIHTAAEEIIAAGGQALACPTDIRFDDQVQAAVKKGVETFGGIDILINNASALGLTGILQTSMKRFDLMHQVNVRGTFLCARGLLSLFDGIGQSPHPQPRPPAEPRSENGSRRIWPTPSRNTE
ncbi:MAG: SDR family NAD(P)-dependent oxidoreductase [Candidatus Manganitrophus sp.]|nr:MAG: SDR family NAD(P)-dependent oxidoreductase [Candidatus Manganitrophus sp.]